MNDLQVTTDLVLSRINQLIEALIANFEGKHSNDNNYMTFDVHPGTKYHKIIEVTNDGPNRLGPSRSVHCFVDKNTGEVYMPASYRGPAKGVRYNLLNDKSFEACIQNADWAGSYLYMK